jgi:hypothetical protein
MGWTIDLAQTASAREGVVHHITTLHSLFRSPAPSLSREDKQPATLTCSHHRRVTETLYGATPARATLSDQLRCGVVEHEDNIVDKIVYNINERAIFFSADAP